MRKTICALVAIAALSAGCNLKDEAIDTVKKAGWITAEFTDIGSPPNLTCEEGEIAYHLKGKNYLGKKVNATVCCWDTYFKGCTIRY